MGRRPGEGLGAWEAGGTLRFMGASHTRSPGSAQLEVPAGPGPSSASSWLEEVEGREASESPLGGGTPEKPWSLCGRAGVGSGSIPSGRTLCKLGGTGLGQSAPGLRGAQGASLSPPWAAPTSFDLAEAHPEAQAAQEQLHHLVVLRAPRRGGTAPHAECGTATEKNRTQPQGPQQTSPEPVHSMGTGA